MMGEIQNRRDFFKGLKTFKVKKGKGITSAPNARLVKISAARHHRLLCVDVRDVKLHGDIAGVEM